MQTVRVGVLGCGNVSRQYLPILTTIPSLDVVALGDVLLDRARSAASEYGVPAALEPAELIADPHVELVVNLTPISVHFEVSAAALAAGKHVYSEKPLAASLEDATRLVEEARRRDLSLACAPDTLLGSGFQAAKAALADGVVGRPLAASGSMFRHSLDVPGSYTLGATPFFDMAPYYLSALVDLFGPACRVIGCTRTLSAEQAAVGQNGAPVVMAGVLEFPSGVMADVVFAWGTGYRSEVPMLTVVGSEGILRLPNPNVFGEPAFVKRHGKTDWEEVPGSRQPDSRPRNLRGLGVAEMAHAMRTGKPAKASAQTARHVVELMAGMVTSSDCGWHVELSTTSAPTDPLSAGEREALLG